MFAYIIYTKNSDMSRVLVSNYVNILLTISYFRARVLKNKLFLWKKMIFKWRIAR